MSNLFHVSLGLKILNCWIYRLVFIFLYILNGCRATKNTYLIVSILMSRATIQNLPFSVYFFPHKNQLRCQRHPPIRLLVLIIKIFFFQTRTEVYFTECVYTKRCPNGTDINYRKSKNCSLIIITLLITHFKSKCIRQLCNTPIFNLLMNGIFYPFCSRNISCKIQFFK